MKNKIEGGRILKCSETNITKLSEFIGSLYEQKPTEYERQICNRKTWKLG